MKIVLPALLLIAAQVLTGCGQTGALYLPDDETNVAVGDDPERPDDDSPDDEPE
ncbi:MAG: lipoprotein [Pseudomonadota bacterium]